MASAGLSDRKDGRYVGLHEILELLARKIFKRGTELHARVVHKDVDSARLGLEPVNRGANRSVIRNIKRQSMDRRPLRAKIRGNAV